MKQLIEFSQEVVDRFLRSKGWDPRHIDRNRRMAFTKTKEFQMYAARMRESMEEQMSTSATMTNKPYTKGLAQTRAHGKDMALKRSVHVNKAQKAVTTEEDCGCSTKKEMSKSARIIKSLYKNKRMQKEELYDHEKDKKEPATYGKKAKVTVGEKQIGDDKTDAAAVLSGGTTLTGQKRDTVMIDPVLKKSKPGVSNSLTDNNDK